MEAVILVGKQTALETQWPQGIPEKTAMDNLQVQYSTLEERWRVLSQSGGRVVGRTAGECGPNYRYGIYRLVCR